LDLLPCLNKKTSFFDIADLPARHASRQHEAFNADDDGNQIPIPHAAGYQAEWEFQAAQ
jgi:hypothetical protein